MILKKPTVEMIRYIRPLYVRTQFNGKPVSKVLMRNGLVLNVMPSRMLRALARNISDLIEVEVFVSTLLEKSLRLLAYSLLTSLWVLRLPYHLSL